MTMAEDKSDLLRRDLLKRGLIGTGVAVSASLLNSASAQTPPPESEIPTEKRLTIANWPKPTETLDLWPNSVAPGLINADLTETVSENSKDPTIHVRMAKGITRPRLCVFPAKNPNGAAMMIIPGGGYVNIWFDHEGYEIADWLNSQGITCFVLFYRLPSEGWAHASDAPLSDAQRAMRLIRSHAGRYGVDPKRIGVMGFSAGGHLTASLATRFEAPVYTPVDPADTLDARPLLAAPIYPVISTDPAFAHMGSRNSLIGANPSPEQMTTYSPDKMVTPNTPPCFLTHAENDGTVPVENTLLFRAALKANKVTVETHLFPDGGHGFGLRHVIGQPTHAWGDLFLAFARTHGLYNPTA